MTVSGSDKDTVAEEDRGSNSATLNACGDDVTSCPGPGSTSSGSVMEAADVTDRQQDAWTGHGVEVPLLDHKVKDVEIEADPEVMQAAEAEEEEDDGVPHDTGWAWVIMMALFVNFVLLSGYLKSSGLFFVELLRKFNAPVTHTALLFSIRAIVFSITGLFVMNIFLAKFGSRRLVMAGAIAMALSAILSSAANQLTQIICINSGLLAMAMSMLISPGEVLLSTYFRRRRALALSLAKCGASIGNIAIPPLITWLLGEYGLSGTLLLFGGMCLHAIPAAMLFRPTSFYSEPHRRRRQRLVELRGKMKLEEEGGEVMFVDCAGSGGTDKHNGVVEVCGGNGGTDKHKGVAEICGDDTGVVSQSSCAVAVAASERGVDEVSDVTIEMYGVHEEKLTPREAGESLSNGRCSGAEPDQSRSSGSSSGNNSKAEPSLNKPGQSRSTGKAEQSFSIPAYLRSQSHAEQSRSSKAGQSRSTSNVEPQQSRNKKDRGSNNHAPVSHPQCDAAAKESDLAALACSSPELAFLPASFRQRTYSQPPEKPLLLASRQNKPDLLTVPSAAPSATPSATTAPSVRRGRPGGLLEAISQSGAVHYLSMTSLDMTSLNGSLCHLAPPVPGSQQRERGGDRDGDRDGDGDRDDDGGEDSDRGRDSAAVVIKGSLDSGLGGEEAGTRKGKGRGLKGESRDGAGGGGEGKGKEEEIAGRSRRRGCWGRCVMSVVQCPGKVFSSLDWSLFRSPVFRLLMLYVIFSPFSNVILDYLPALAQENGVSEPQAALLLSIIGGLDLLCRLLCGVLADLRLVKVTTMITVTFIIMAVVAQFVRFMTSFEHLVILAVFQGFFGGVGNCLAPVLVIELVGLTHMGKALGFWQLISGASMTLIYPFLGYIRDVTGSFSAVYHLVGCGILVAGLLLCFEGPVRRMQDKKAQRRSVA